MWGALLVIGGLVSQGTTGLSPVVKRAAFDLQVQADRTMDQIWSIEQAYLAQPSTIVMAGYNQDGRFTLHIHRQKQSEVVTVHYNGRLIQANRKLVEALLEASLDPRVDARIIQTAAAWLGALA